MLTLLGVKSGSGLDIKVCLRELIFLFNEITEMFFCFLLGKNMHYNPWIRDMPKKRIHSESLTSVLSFFTLAQAQK